MAKTRERQPAKRFSQRMRVVATPFMVVGMLQVAGCFQDRSIPPPPPGGTYLSTTAGANFEQSVMIEAGEGTHIAGLSLGEIFRPAHQPGTIYVAAGANGVVVSNNGGETWRVVPVPLGFTRDFVVLKNNIMVAVGTGDEGQGFIIRSLDNGENWEEVMTIPRPVKKRRLQLFSEPEVPPVVLNIEVDPINPDRIYAGSNLGSIFVGEDSARLWHKSYTLPGSEAIERVIPSPHQPNELFIITTGGAAYILRNNQLDSMKFAVPVNPLEQVENPPLISLGRIFDIVLLPGAPGKILVAAQGGAVVSEDNGVSWRELRLPIDPSQKFNRAIIAVSPSNPSRIFVSFNGILYRSENGGVNWHIYDFTLPSHVISAVLIEPQNAARVLIVMTPLAV